MKPAKAVYTVILVITILFGAIVSGLGILLGWCASQIGIWTAPPPTFAPGYNAPYFYFNISYGPIPYTGFLYNIRIEVGVTMYNDTVGGVEIGNGTGALNLVPGSSGTLKVNVQFANETNLLKVRADFFIQGIVTLFIWDWLSVDISTSFNVTDVTP